MLYIEPNLEHSRLFLDKKKELKHKLELLLARGTADFTLASRKLYAEPDKDTLKEAETAMELFTEDDSTAKTITATQLVDHFNSMFKDLGVEGWQARTADILADCTAQQRKQKILVRQDATFTEEHKQKLTLHEFYTHVLTTINGNLQPYRLLKLGTPLFLRTQEGLAVYNQSHFATPPRESQNSKSALLYYTICQAQNKSFRHTYDTLKKLNYSDELCWQLTLKAKRGLADTSQAGGFTKDLLYFSGYLRIRNFVKNGGDLHRLYIGKVDLDTLDQIEQLPGIKPPRFTPPFLDPDSIR
jgi:hypothetical protein